MESKRELESGSGPGSTRRELLTAAGLGLLLVANFDSLMAAAETAQARLSGEDWVALGAAEAACLGALADQIFPPDETPGAVAIGVLHFMDAALAGFMADSLPGIREGVADLDARAAVGHAGHSFADLDFDQQLVLVKAIEDSGFFANVHYLTLAGLFAMPAWGGNRDQLGWQALGFEARHGWQPPFGFYDAQAAQATQSASHGESHDY